MAVKRLSTTSALKKLEEQLTCAICLDLYTNPKSLPCLHSFCQRCLEGLPLDPQGDNYFISCPTCRYRIKLPQPNGAADFPTAFQINNFKEVHNLLIKVSGQQQVTCKNCTTTNATGYCKECAEFFCQECINGHKKYAPIACHNITNLDEVATSAIQLLPVKREIKCSTHNEPLKIFCGTCEELACFDCTVRIHRGHDYDLITDCYPKHCQKLETNLKPVSEKIAAIIDVLRDLKDRENEIKEQDKIIKEEIHVMVEEKIDVLRQSERELTREVDTITASKLQVLSEQEKSAETGLSQLKDCKEVVEQSLKIGSPQQVVTSTKQMIDRITHVTQQVEVEEFIPREKANLRFDKTANIDDVLHHIGNISTNAKSTQSLSADISTSAKLVPATANLKYIKSIPTEVSKSKPVKLPTKTGSFQIMFLGNNRTLTVKRSDIVSENVDVIVNAADEQLEHTGGVAGALNIASKGELQKHSKVFIKQKGLVPVGGVAITQAGGNLKCKQVIHAVGPVGSPFVSDQKCSELLHQAVTNTLIEAQKLKASSISLPAISTGVFSVKKELAAEAILNAILTFNFTSDKLKDIRIVIINEPTYVCFAQHLITKRNIMEANDNPHFSNTDHNSSGFKVSCLSPISGVSPGNKPSLTENTRPLSHVGTTTPDQDQPKGATGGNYKESKLIIMTIMTVELN